jgi:predicted AlkP superfamily phosphohydrolase/phosphomutase
MIERCERYFSSLDRLIGDAVAQAGADTTVVLASDHGFGPTRDVFHVNSWLAEKGYLFWAGDQRGGERSATEIGFAEMTRHVRALDWSRTVAYAATPSSQGIHIVETIPGTEERMPEEARARITCELAEALLQLERPWDGKPLVETVWAREQAFPGPYERYGPDLSMVLADGGTMSILPSETIVARRPETRGHHRWEGIFLAAGPGIRPGVEVDELSIVDVAPFVMHRMQLPVPADMSGRVPEAIYEPDELLRNPPRRGPAATPPPVETETATVELAPEEQTAVMQRLRALGYVE